MGYKNNRQDCLYNSRLSTLRLFRILSAELTLFRTLLESYKKPSFRSIQPKHSGKTVFGIGHIPSKCN